MKQLAEETEANFNTFSQSFAINAQATAQALNSERKKFLESYRRIVSLNAWRTELLEGTISQDSLAFFLEAQNDALTSHVLARFGSWRSALKSLRSCIENVLYCLYYKDHPIELQLWHEGRHRLAFAETLAYFSEHPRLTKIARTSTGLAMLSNQYSVLSRAVHASAKNFRMSVEGVGVQLWSSDRARLGKWVTNEKETLTGLNRLLLGLFSEHLHLSRLPNLRKAVSLILPARLHDEIKKNFGVPLFS